MANILGIVNFESDRVNVEGLSDFRPVAAISFLGRYRVIDFVLSNMVNSHINQIKILVKYKPRSLIDHIGGGTQYNINSKTGSLQILYADQQIANKMYYTDIALLNQYKLYIEDSHCDYVVIAPSYMICKIDYQQVLRQHLQTGADVTCVYKEIEECGDNYVSCHNLYMNDEGWVIDAKVNHGGAGKKNISMEAYLCSKEVFFKILETATKDSGLYSLRTYLGNNPTDFKMHGYKYEGYFACLNSLKSYFNTSMELIDHEKAKGLFSKDWPIYTKTNDSAPAFYSKDANVKNCLIANGCVVQGELENCILGRGVKIKKGAKIKNSVILPGAIIGEDSNLEYTVVDKSAQVKCVKDIVGDQDHILYIKRRDIV